MGENTLTARVDGNKIPANDHNELVQALQIDLVPRNNSRAPQDIIGQLGTSAVRWLRAYVKTYHIGDSANGLTISEAVAGEIHIKRGSSAEEIRLRNGALEFYIAGVKSFEITPTKMNTFFNGVKSLEITPTLVNMYINGTLKTKIDSNGFDGQYIKLLSTSYETMTNTKRFIKGNVLVQSDLDTNDTLSTLSLAVRNGFRYRVSLTARTYSYGGGGWNYRLSADAVELNDFGAFGNNVDTFFITKTSTWIYTATANATVVFRWYAPSSGGNHGVNGGQAYVEEI